MEKGSHITRNLLVLGSLFGLSYFPAVGGVSPLALNLLEPRIAVFPTYARYYPKPRRGRHYGKAYDGGMAL